jgi:hypothetical protein
MGVLGQAFTNSRCQDSMAPTTIFMIAPSIFFPSYCCKFTMSKGDGQNHFSFPSLCIFCISICFPPFSLITFPSPLFVDTLLHSFISFISLTPFLCPIRTFISPLSPLFFFCHLYLFPPSLLSPYPSSGRK